MDWLDSIQSNRRRQVSQMAKAFGHDATGFIQKADDEADLSDKGGNTVDNKVKKQGGKSDMYKMKILGLRKFNDQDLKEYIGVEDVANSYIANHENGDILITKTADGYLVSKFPIDMNNEEGEEKEAANLSEAIDVALQYKNDLDNAKEPEQIMYKEADENTTDDSGEDADDYNDEDDTHKGFDDEINPFERAAWDEGQDELRKAYETLVSIFY